jgi:hypothetical protein
MKKALESAGASTIRRHHSTLIAEIAIAFPVTLALWLCVYYFLPPVGSMEEPLARLVLALKCCCIAVLFCFLTGIEAVAHERLRSPAIDPLSGYETRRLTINLRYLQNTFEQLVVFGFLDRIPLWVTASRNRSSRHDAKHAGPPLRLCEDWL